ncbi:MAG: hypothetical protein ACP5E4_03250, partial [Candidatus Aenigmatarchaeota archaeon]
SKMAKFLDAVNIEIKGGEEAYSALCMASRRPVLDALLEYKKQGVWIEITCLIIPGHNDSEEQMNETASWINENLGEETPLHISRFHPAYKLTKAKPTPLKTLERLYLVASKRLRYVYIGNINTKNYENTFCPRCGGLVIARDNYRVRFEGPLCRKCGAKIEGVFG